MTHPLTVYLLLALIGAGVGSVGCLPRGCLDEDAPAASSILIVRNLSEQGIDEIVVRIGQRRLKHTGIKPGGRVIRHFAGTLATSGEEPAADVTATLTDGTQRRFLWLSSAPNANLLKVVLSPERKLLVGTAVAEWSNPEDEPTIDQKWGWAVAKCTDDHGWRSGEAELVSEGSAPLATTIMLGTCTEENSGGAVDVPDAGPDATPDGGK